MALHGEYEARAVIVGTSIIIAGVLASLALPRKDIVFLGASLLAGIVVVFGDQLARTLSLLAWAVTASTMGQHLIPLAVLAGVAGEALYHPSRIDSIAPGEARRLLVLAAFYTPVVIVYPASILPLTAYTVTLLVDWMIMSSRLTKAVVSVLEKDVTVEYGEEAIIPVKIKAGVGRIHYSLLLDGHRVLMGVGEGEEYHELKVKPVIVGAEKHTVEAVIADWRGRARRRIGPYTVTVRTTLSSIRALLRIRRILQAYREAIRRPQIYRGEPRLVMVELEAEGVGRGGKGEGRGEGETGEGAGFEEGRRGLGGAQLHSIIFPVDGEGEEVLDVAVVWTPVSTGREYTGGRGLRGDYRGVREYIPGDRPTQIHWKKTASRRELVVKTYEGGIGGGGGKSRLLVIADWVSRNPAELDDLVKKTYSAILQGGGEKILLLRLPRGILYLIRGGVPEVLEVLDDIIRSEGIMQYLDYGGWRRSRTAELYTELLRDKGVMGQIARYLLAYAKAVVSSLEGIGVEPGTSYTIIHSDATAVWNQALKRALNNSLGEPIPIEEIPVEEAALRLRRLLAGYKA